jgi:hypothetical protein
MPDPLRLLKTIARAIEAIRDQPGRSGRVVDLADAEEILIAGDLHGHVGNFQALYRIADLAKNPRRHLIIQEVVHGKFYYPLGGDKSHQLLDLFSALKAQFPARVHMLMGNHELAQWTDRPIIKGDDDLNALFLSGLEEAYGEQASGIYGAYRRLFAVLPFAIRTANRIFISHSAPTARHAGNFRLGLLQQDEHDLAEFAPKGCIYSLVWGRDCSAENIAAFLKKVDCDWLVSGHIPCEHGFEAPNEQQLILDSCSSPAAYALLPARRSLTRNEFYSSVFLI